LAREALQELRVGGEFTANHFYRDRTSAGRDAEENLAHPAVTQPADQPVYANLAGVPSPQRIHRSRGSNPVPLGPLHDTPRLAAANHLRTFAGKRRVNRA